MLPKYMRLKSLLWPLNRAKNSLQSLWQKLDYYQVIKMKCSKDAAILKNFVENDYMFDFLVGLNLEFDQVWIKIPTKEGIPSLKETISLIYVEEN